MSTPQRSEDADGTTDAGTQVQSASPAYSTPPPEGLPSADDDTANSSE